MCLYLYLYLYVGTACGRWTAKQRPSAFTMTPLALLLLPSTNVCAALS